VAAAVLVLLVIVIISLIVLVVIWKQVGIFLEHYRSLKLVRTRTTASFSAWAREGAQ
jgi:hypothetical protein